MKNIKSLESLLVMFMLLAGCGESERTKIKESIYTNTDSHCAVLETIYKDYEKSTEPIKLLQDSDYCIIGKI